MGLPLCTPMILYRLLVALLVFSACGSPAAPSATGSMGPPTMVTTSADLAFCVSETNRYRAQVPVPALMRDPDLEDVAMEGARVDAQSATPHTHFRNTPQIRRAQNEIHRLPLAQFGSVRTLITETLASFWREGPSGGHYQNLTGPYTRIGCGVAIREGEVTFVQDFQ